MPTLVALRFNPDLKVIYTQIVAAGKRQKLALTACIGKTVSRAVF